MPHASPSSPDARPEHGLRLGPTLGSPRKRGIVPLILAAVATLVLGGASVAQEVTVPALDARADLEFSLDGSI